MALKRVRLDEFLEVLTRQAYNLIAKKRRRHRDADNHEIAADVDYHPTIPRVPDEPLARIIYGEGTPRWQCFVDADLEKLGREGGEKT